jgi:hypothetical protein
MLIHSSTTFDIAVAAHRTRVASAMAHRRLEHPWQSRSSSASADRQHPPAQRRFQAGGRSRRSLRRLSQ